MMLSCGAANAQYVSKAWSPDVDKTTYRNPIINADYSDPDVCRVGDDYYMTASSFNCIPGLPILHSKDLVHWSIVGHAIKRLLPEDFYSKAQNGKGVWAPSIRYHDGTYYIYWGDPDFGIFMTKTTDPRGEWDEPVLVVEGLGMIDCTPLWDDDGKVYLVNAYARSRALFNSVATVRELSADGTHAIGAPVMIYDGLPEGNFTLEGTKFYKRNGYYYILAPAGGVATGWQVALRSKNVYGPYTAKTVMHQGKSKINGPHQGGYVDTPFGESWFINFQDKGAYGRVIHLNPMKWVNDWPVIGEDKDGDGCGEPVETYRKPKSSYNIICTPQESDDFSTPTLGRQWQWQANYAENFGFPTPNGYFRLYGSVSDTDDINLWNVPNLLLQKFPADTFTATMKAKVFATSEGQQSGLVVYGIDYCRLSVERVGEDFTISQIKCRKAETGGKETIVATDVIKANHFKTGEILQYYEQDIWFRVKVSEGGMCKFSYSLDGKKYKAIGEEFKSREGRWVGAKVGMFSVAKKGMRRGWMNIDNFEITK